MHRPQPEMLPRPPTAHVPQLQTPQMMTAQCEAPMTSMRTHAQPKRSPPQTCSATHPAASPTPQYEPAQTLETESLLHVRHAPPQALLAMTTGQQEPPPIAAHSQLTTHRAQPRKSAHDQSSRSTLISGQQLLEQSPAMQPRAHGSAPRTQLAQPALQPAKPWPPPHASSLRRRAAQVLACFRTAPSRQWLSHSRSAVLLARRVAAHARLPIEQAPP